MNKTVTTGLAALILAAFTLFPAAIAVAVEPADLLDVWQESLADADYPTYLDCLHSGARGVPEYGSREAMRFWTQEMGRLREQGFAGRFVIEAATASGPRFPAGTLLAHPIIDGEPTDDAIVLIQEAGEWKILRLFS
jgi:hypothetical protein